MSTKEWKFSHVVSSQDNKPVSEAVCNELLEAFITKAESLGLVVGGGVRPLKSSEDE